jgi:hypothetical protein
MKAKAVDFARPALVAGQLFDFGFRIGGCEAAKDDTSVGRHHTASQTVDPTEHSGLTSVTPRRSAHITAIFTWNWCAIPHIHFGFGQRAFGSRGLRAELDQLMAYASRVVGPLVSRGC